MKKISSDEYYAKYYNLVINENLNNLFGKFLQLTHKTLERQIKVNSNYDKVLELGSGDGRHFKYVKHQYSTYFETDIRFFETENISKEYSGNNFKRMRMYQNAEDLIFFKSQEIDRIIATCLLIHLKDPKKALIEWKRVIKKRGGVINIYVPCEPGLLIRFARKFTTIKNAKKLGIDHAHFHYLEHKYSYIYLKFLIEDIFMDAKISWKNYPFFWNSWNFNLWSICTIEFGN
jgi:phosphatidylethanolamine/phosphatidyl-N-methylethanolamine N-methyltransferase